MTEPAPDATLTVLSTLAVQGAMDAIAARFQAATGIALSVSFAPTQVLLGRIEAGETADVAILTRDGVDALVTRGILRAGSETDLALSTVGVAVRAGAPHPAIGTVDEFVAALRRARSICYSRSGASGLHFAALLDRLGLAAEVNAKATVIPSGFTAALAADGRAELAIQQISELLAVPGIEVMGPLPAEIGSVTMFSAGVFAGSARSGQADRFSAFLNHDEVRTLLQQAGLTAVGEGPRHA